ncbi:hypothetical protein AMS68_003310 [Peltaster fructicola]|uniref:Uncharacterized protein n=1 Tax=Peltaster fructicola TaxID=286661 RepID=A0A6H0XSU8_9PEZI|nr:hypothetical protein AMS68_003310 [Peltaster fructicola]
MDAEFASAQSSRPTSSSATPTQPQLALSCDVQSQMIDDLVRFKFANQGLLLVAQSAQELRTNPNANNEYQRRLYLDGVAYLLRALPEELTDTERVGSKAALPAEIRESDRPQESITQPQDEPRQSAFRMMISVLVFWCFFAFATALPYMKFLARRLHEFERRHKLGEQCLNRTLSLVQITSAQLIAVLCAVWAYNDGIIGQKLADFGVWCAENVGDGVRDGLREAAAALRRSQDDK